MSQVVKNKKGNRGFSRGGLELVACTIDMTSLGSADNNPPITMVNKVGKLAPSLDIIVYPLHSYYWVALFAVQLEYFNSQSNF